MSVSLLDGSGRLPEPLEAQADPAVVVLGTLYEPPVPLHRSFVFVSVDFALEQLNDFALQ